jgi:hypothetical protein
VEGKIELEKFKSPLSPSLIDEIMKRKSGVNGIAV